VTTVAGKRWPRVRIVEHPLSEYLCYEIEGYVESATGEEIQHRRPGRAPRSRYAGHGLLAV
jgi:hypothetical protein